MASTKTYSHRGFAMTVRLRAVVAIAGCKYSQSMYVSTTRARGQAALHCRTGAKAVRGCHLQTGSAVSTVPSRKGQSVSDETYWEERIKRRTFLSYV